MSTITYVKRTLLILFMIAVYVPPLVLIVLTIGTDSLDVATENTIANYWFLGLAAGIALAFINNIVAIVEFCRRSKGDYTRALREMRTYKLILAPYFILNFLMWTIFIALTLLFVTWLLIPLGVFHAWAVMFTTSFYAILKIIDLMKRKKISAGKGILMIILQLTFVLDIIGIIYLGHLEKKLEDVPETLIPQQIP